MAIEIPDISVFASLVAEPRFVLAIGVAALSGLVRGFTGFGAALIYVPLMSAFYGPQVASATVLLLNLTAGAVVWIPVWRKAHLRDVVPMVIASLAAVQFGALFLQYSDPVVLRWLICLVVAVIVAVLVSGWRYHGTPYLAVMLAVGLLAGFLGGATQMSGPPVIIYWLGSLHSAAIVRANFIVYFALLSVGTFTVYAFNGLLTAPVIALALMLAAPFFLANGIGSALHHRTSERTYRRVAYVVIAASAVAGLPLFDQLRR